MIPSRTWRTRPGPRSRTSAQLYVDRNSGRSISETIWEDEEVLAASRSSAAAIRVEMVAATNCAIRAVEEYSLLFSSARKA